MHTLYDTTRKINFVTLILLTLFFNACSKKLFFQTNKSVPAARGFIQVKKDGNNNYFEQFILHYAGILVILWGIGFLTMHLGGLIHLLLVIAILLRLIKGGGNV